MVVNALAAHHICCRRSQLDASNITVLAVLMSAAAFRAHELI